MSVGFYWVCWVLLGQVCQIVTGCILRPAKLKMFFFQFGNTCYCNSVLQALYFCQPFREKVLAYKPQNKRKETLLTCLSDLFGSISSQKKKVGVMAPKKFVARLRKENGKGIENSKVRLKPLFLLPYFLAYTALQVTYSPRICILMRYKTSEGLYLCYHQTKLFKDQQAHWVTEGRHLSRVFLFVRT